MHQSKSSKIIKQARSSISTFTEKHQLSLNPKDLKLSRIYKKLKRTVIQEKPLKDSPKLLEKSASGLKASKIPKTREKSESSVPREKRPKDPSPVLIPSNGSLGGPMARIANSPKLCKSLSPLSEIHYEVTKNKGPHLKEKGKIGQNMLRHLNLKEEIELNQKILNNPHRFKAKSCLEDLILIGESKELTGFAFIEENLKTCTNILRNIMGRLLQTGKSNEAVLLEKFWRHLVETFDQTIEAFISVNAKSESMIDGKFKYFSHNKT